MSVSTSKVSRVPLAEAPTFGKYHLIAKLGQGGMADVFLAVARGPAGFNKLVVIKRLKQGVTEEAEFHGMFLDEARLAARLNHPNVVQTNEVGQAAGHYFLCMEYLEGQPLNRIMTRLNRATGKPPVPGTPTARSALPEMLRILCDALTGLHYAHELADYDGTPLKVVHRDVSPHNVFVTYDGVAKMVDFGIAKAAVRSAYTSTGVVKGKISYMAPEQALSAPIDRRADVFSMGVILWELAAGERLWGTLSEVQILQKMAFGEVPRLASRVPDAPPQLDGICARALAMVPGERYATAAELRDEVERYLKQSNANANNADVSKLVSGMFKDRRDEVKAVIQEQLRDMKEDGTLPPRDVTVPDIAVSTESNVAVRPAPGFPKEISEAGPASIEATPSLSGTMSTSAIQRALPKRRLWPTVVVGIVAGLGIGGLLAWRAGIYERLRGEPQAATSASTASVGTERPVSTAGAASLIELRIGAQPPAASIYLDDVAVGKNPFTAKFPRDGTAHRLRVEAPGHKTHSQLLVFDGDVGVDVQLVAEGAPGPLTSASAASSAPVRTAPVGGRPRGPKVDTSDPFAPAGKGR